MPDYGGGKGHFRAKGQTETVLLGYVPAIVIPVFIDADRAGESSTEVLLAACSQVVRPNVCVLASSESAVARVLWPDPLRVDLAIDAADHQEHREIVFRPADLPSARWQAAGLVLGSMLHDAETATRSVAPEPAATPAPQLAPSASRASTSSSVATASPMRSEQASAASSRPRPLVDHANQTNINSRSPTPITGGATPTTNDRELVKRRLGAVAPNRLDMIFGFGALTGLGLARSDSGGSSARLGGWLELEARAYRGLGLTGTANISWLAGGFSGVTGSWVSFGLGPSLAQPMGSRVTFLLRPAILREQLSLSWATEHGSRAYWGWRVAAGVEGRMTEMWTFEGLVALAGSPAQSVRIGGVEVASNPAVAPIVLVGLQIHFWRLGVPGS